MLRTIKKEEIEAGEADLIDLHGGGRINPPKSTTTNVNQGQKRPIQNNNNNGVAHKRPNNTFEAFGIGSSKMTMQSGTSAGARIPKDTSTTPNNTYRAPCWNCKKIVLRGPTPHHKNLQNFCTIECGREFNQRTGDDQGFSNPSLLSPIVGRNLNKPATRPPSSIAAGLQKQIQQLGKQISQTHRRVLGDDDPDEGDDLDEELDPDLTSLKEDFFQADSSSASNADFDMPPKKKKKKEENPSFDWMGFLKNPEFNAASVSLVKHAPLARMWENVTVGMKLEVENTDIDYLLMEKAFWVASVINIHGYYVQLRYEGFGNDSTGDFWINLCSPSVHHVGWCANKGKPLIPPKSIAKKFSDWRNFLVNRLTGARTLPLNFLAKIDLGMKSQNKINDTLEVVDKAQISQLKVAFVKEIVGRRLHVEYFDNNEDGGFWCHEESRLIHPAGWALTIGHKIGTPPNYHPPMLAGTPYDAEYEAMNLKVGMKLEAIDPLNLSAICAATIKQVLKRGYVMVRVDCYEEDSSGTDWFCYHISSPYVYPCGYCATNGVALTPPTGYDKATFTWDQYFKETNAIPAPVKVKKALNHKFTVGMKVEVADLMDPRLICVATICQVVGRLLKIHFDGWEDEYDQWMDARSPDIYPIGWCEMVNHRLEPPRPPIPVQRQPTLKKAKKGKKKVGIRGGKGARANKTSVNSAKILKLSKTPGPKSTSNINQIVKTPTAVNETAPTSTSSQKLDEQFDLKTKPVTAAPTIRELFLANPAKSSTNGGSVKKVAEGSKDVPSTVNNIGRKASTSKMLEANIPKALDNQESMKPVEPVTWNIQEVADFLTSHDCGSYCEGFIKNDIDGEKLMALTKDQIVLLTGMKVGPAVKIYDLISQLKKCAAKKSALLKD